MEAFVMKKNISAMTECAVLVALAFVLSLIKIWQMPLGGAVTLGSMLPVCLISVRRGVKYGVGAAFVYSVLQLAVGVIADGIFGWGLNAAMLAGCIFFDYIGAFTVLGLAGLFRTHGEGGIYAGIALACGLRFISHFISGYVIFENLGQFELFGNIFEHSPVLYSAAYNGLFMLPELILTLAASAVLMRIPFVRTKIFAPLDK